MFGPEHVYAMFVSLLMIILIPWGAKKFLSENKQFVLGQVIGWIVFFNFIIWVALEIIAGTFDYKVHLPIQLCRFTNITLPLVMVWRSYLAYEILFFWGFSGILQATITPDVAAGFPHYQFFRFWIGHQGTILALVYATVVYEIRPTFQSLIRSFMALNVFLMFTIVFNILFDANYFWICGKPVDQLGKKIPTLLDFLGPWPWYILSAELIAIINFLLAYTPFYFITKKSRETL